MREQIVCLSFGNKADQLMLLLLVVLVVVVAVAVAVCNIRNVAATFHSALLC